MGAIKSPIPTGNPWQPSPGDPATVPVPLPVIIVSVDGPYTESDRKLWVLLLHAVWDQMDENGSIHEIAVSDINRLFRELGGEHNSKWIWESARRLTKTTIEWRYTEGDKRYEGIAALFSAVISKTARDSGILRFHFPLLLIPILKDPRRFARLRTHFMIELSGKYAVTLYELLESAANKEVPELRATVDELRQWLKVPAGKLTRWPDFLRRALEPALKQINDNAEGAGFRVRMHTEKKGNATKWIVFHILKTKERQVFDARLREQDKQYNLFDVHLKTETFERAKTLAPGWDTYLLVAEWKEWGQQNPGWPPKHPDAAFLGFCKQRGSYPGRH